MVTQLSRWDNVGTEAPAGDAEYVAGQQPIAEWDNYFNWSAAKDVENLIAALENVATGHDHDGTNSKKVDGSDVVNTPAGNVAATDVQAAINELDTEKSLIANITDMDEQSFTNLLENGGFESWSAGTSAAPDEWELIGSGAAVAQESTIIKRNTYSAKLTRSGTDCFLINRIFETSAPDILYLRERTVTIGAWVYATVANRARLRTDDGIDVTLSDFHSGNSTWEWLTVSYSPFNVSGTTLYHQLMITGGDTSAYISGAIVVEGSVCPAFSPKPITNSDLKFRGITSVAVNTTLTDSHYTVGVDASGAARTITLPAAADNTGRIYNISKRDSSANTVTIDANAAELINGVATSVISTQYGSYTIQSDGTGWWVI